MTEILPINVWRKTLFNKSFSIFGTRKLILIKREGCMKLRDGTVT